MTKKIDHFAFLERARMNPDVFPLEVRQTEFREVYKPFDQPMAAEQAERCLDCGNPYCEWKCPVHNYIPNWLRLAGEGRILESFATRPTACRKYAAGFARRTACVSRPARWLPALAR
jgi:glutamate synthase (NADPH/NADH) small chain